jgi:signal transduction histidine kinase
MSISFSAILYGAVCLVYTVLLVRTAWKVHRAHGQLSGRLALAAAFPLLLLVLDAARLFLQLSLPPAFRTAAQVHFSLYASLLVAGGLLDTTWTFLHRKSPALYARALFLVYFGVAAIVNDNPGGILLDRIQVGPLQLWRPSIGLVLLHAGWVFCSACAVIAIFAAYRQAQGPLYRNRYAFWLTAVYLAIAGLVVAAVLPTWAPIAVILFACAALGLQFTIFRHQLPDIRQISRRLLSFIVSVALSTFVYTVSLLWIQSLLVAYQVKTQSLVQAAVFAAVLTLLLNPLINLVQRRITVLILRSGYDEGRLISAYSQKISNIIDLAQLSEVITGAITIHLGVRKAVLFLAHTQPDGFELKPIRPAGAEPVTLCLSGSSPLVEYLQAEHKPLAQYDIDLLPRFSSIPSSEAAALKALGLELYVPLSIQDRWTGLIGLSAKKSGDRFSEVELFILESLASQTAVALDNARLYQDLLIRNAENERLNWQLTAANRELERLDMAKSDFINIASHELRTPLASVMGYNDILIEMFSDNSIEPGQALGMANGVAKGARRLVEIVDTMFEVSRLDTASFELRLSTIQLAAVVSAAAEKWQDALQTRHLALVIEDLSGLPDLCADQKRLVQVFAQLIQNAIKNTPDGGEIRISAQVTDAGKQNDQTYIELVIADTGIGIDPEDHERIFEKFYRVGSFQTHSTGDIKFKGAGPGLGLTICRGIVEAHGGRIWAESPGYDEVALPGSRMHVLLPVSSRLAASVSATERLFNRRLADAEGPDTQE